MRVGSSTSLSSTGFDVSCTSPSAVVVDEALAKKVRTYGKFLSSRLVQAIVQSRTNEKFSQPCLAPSSLPAPDWFNVRLDELGEVSAMCKGVSKFPPDIPALSIDFFLYTVDGDTLPLETWCFSVDDDAGKYGGEDNTSLLYHQLGILLRSAMAAARMTPMHRYYVKKQGPDTYVILYRVIEGPSCLDLGAGKKSHKIGAFPSPLGTMNLDLHFRTKMEIERKPSNVSPISESFHQVTLASTGEQESPVPQPVFGSPESRGSFCEVVSNFSTSPGSIATSPPQQFGVTPPRGGSLPHPHSAPPINFVTRARSRTQSTRSSNSIESPCSPPKSDSGSFEKEGRERRNSQSQVGKDFPFANLLQMSFTGMLYPLQPVTEENGGTDSRKGSKQETNNENNSGAEEKGSGEVCDDGDNDPLLPFAMDRSGAASTVVASACATVKNSMLSESTENTKRTEESKENEEEEDDDGQDEDESFVKIPLFGTGSPATGSSVDHEIGELISACRSVPSIASFDNACNQLTNLSQQIEQFERSQCVFDEFVSDINEANSHID